MFLNSFKLLAVFSISLLIFIFLITSTNADDSNSTISTTTEAASAAPKLLKLQIYYEAQCPDSMSFIRGRLNYAMINYEWLQYTDLQFIPYGKVSSWTDPETNVTQIYCQHGMSECELNALHACIVEHNKIEEQVKMISCLLGSYNPDVDKCASSLSIDISAAKICKSSRDTKEILQKYGELTNAIDLTFVPSIAFDNVFDPWSQNSYLYRFYDAFCRKYKEKFDIKLSNC